MMTATQRRSQTDAADKLEAQYGLARACDIAWSRAMHATTERSLNFWLQVSIKLASRIVPPLLS